MRRYSGGFSLIESLVAVVVLAIGILGLARLQASLTRSAVDLYADADAQLLGNSLLELNKTSWIGNLSPTIRQLTPANGTNLTSGINPVNSSQIVVTTIDIRWTTASATQIWTIKSHTNNTLRPADSRWLLATP